MRQEELLAAFDKKKKKKSKLVSQVEDVGYCHVSTNPSLTACFLPKVLFS